MSGSFSHTISLVSLLALPAAASAPLPRVIVPGDVVLSPYLPSLTAPFTKTGYGLTGTFRVVRSSESRAIVSNGTGGACLIADLNGFGIPKSYPGTCRTDAECHNRLSAHQREVEKWASYCVVDSPKLIPGVRVRPAQGTCWTRPGTQPSYCTVSPETPWQDGVPVRVPAGAGMAKLYPAWASGVQIRWRLRACLNGVDGTPAGSPCSGAPGTALKVDGPALTLPK